MMCGAPLAGSALRQEERKVVTILFADLVGFTSRSERMDVEDVRGTLVPFHQLLRRELERFGGTVEKFIGDAVMALFGAPVAHEDDSERAVRAALSIQEAVARLRESDPALDLHVRIGVNTGEALVALGANPQAGEGMASGDVVNTAARLQSAAPVDGVLVGEGTYWATDRAIRYEPAEPVVAKGKSEPVPAWLAVEPRSLLPEQTRVAGLPLVGRDEELRLVVSAFARSRREPSCQLVTVVGAPGIGKTRLVEELLSHVEALPELVWWRRGRSLAYGEGVAFWALGEMVKAQAGILESDSVEEAGRKLDAAVAALVESERDQAWVARHLRPLVGLAADAAGTGEGDRGEAFAAWRRFFEALAEGGATVLVFEDAHWADDALLDFIDLLADRAGSVPLLIVCTARPELLARRPHWGGGKINSQTINLTPLSNGDTARLVGVLLEQALLPADTQQALLERAQGNPLYAQEYVRMLRDRGLLVRDGAGWRLTGTPEGLPESVQAIIAARLDALTAEEKQLLWDAAVVGKTAWVGAVCALCERSRWQAEELVYALERKQLVQRARRSSIHDELEFSFSHAFTHEVAYAQIPRRQRAAKHERTAGWIEQLAADRDDKAELVAHHYLTALAIMRQTGDDATALSAKAVDAVIAAGRQAHALNAYQAAAEYLTAALGLLSDTDERRADVLLELARARYSAGGADEVTLLAARDSQVAAEHWEGAAWAEVLLGMWAEEALGDGARADEHYTAAAEYTSRIAYAPVTSLVTTLQMFRFVKKGQPARAVEMADAAVARATNAADDVGRGVLLNMRGVAKWTSGDDDGSADIETAADILEGVAHPKAVGAYSNLGEVYLAQGLLEECFGAHEHLAALASRFGDAQSVASSDMERADVLYHRGEWERALSLTRPYVDDSIRSYAAWCRTSRGWINLARADAKTAVADAEIQIDYATTSGNDELLLHGLALQTLALRATRTAHSATVAWNRFVERLSAENRFPSLAPLLARLALAAADERERDHILAALNVLPHRSRWHAAIAANLEQRHADATKLYEDIGSKPLAALAHMQAAQQLRQQGREAEAVAHAQNALSFWRSVGATLYMRECQALLARAASA
jgi:class 3 adenylate cyclase